MNPGPESSELDPALERAWRAHSREAPPPELDRAILAAAHRAAGSGPQDASKAVAEATRPQRWWMPLAAVATIGVIAIGILQLTPREDPLVAPEERAATVVRSGAQEQVPAPAVSQSVDDAVKERDAASVGARSETSAFRQKKEQEAKPAAAVPVPAPSAPPAPARTGRDGGLAGNEALGQAAPAAWPSPLLARKPASLDDLRAQARDPDAWIVRIRKLRDAGDTAEAMRELREFRNLVPDADRRLPADLLAWANTVKP